MLLKPKAEWESTVGSPFISYLVLCGLRDIAFENYYLGPKLGYCSQRRLEMHNY